MTTCVAYPTELEHDRAMAERESTVTFLMADVENAYELRESNPESMAATLRSLTEVIEMTASSRNGRPLTAVPFGIACAAAFTSATDAMFAASEARAALDAPLSFPMASAVRLALHTGDARVSDGESLGGETVRRCRQILALARGGQVVMSSATAAVVQGRTLPGQVLVPFEASQSGGLTDAGGIFGLVRSHGDPPPMSLREHEPAPTNLPAPTTAIIGRRPEIAGLQERLRTGRLVTVTGSGGCGKTRLAIAVATAMLGEFDGGVWWTDMSHVRSHAEVWGAIARACRASEVPGLSAEATVNDILAERRALLILDGCEHVVAAVAQAIGELFDGCPSAVVLVTSREAIGIAAEVSFQLPSLPSHEAIELFADRARRVRSDFELGPTLGHVAAICERLDGIPLAIELAAVRVRSMSPASLSAQLHERFRILTGGDRTAVARHRTLLASIDWSYDLLDDSERAAFRRLGIFCGVFTMNAAQAVAGDGLVDEWSVFDLVDRLVAKHLVVFDGEVYRLLDTIRLYAIDRARELGEIESARHRHARLMAGLVGSADVRSQSTGELKRLLDPHADDLRSAAEWLLTERHPLSFEFFRDLGEWIWRTGRFADVRHLAGVLAEHRAPGSPDYAIGYAGFLCAARLCGAPMDQPDEAALTRSDPEVVLWLEAAALRIDSFSGRGDVAEALERCAVKAREHEDGTLTRLCLESAAIAHSRMGRFRKVHELVGVDVDCQDPDMLLSLKVAPAAAAGRWHDVRGDAIDMIVDAVEPWVNVTMSATVWAAVLFGDRHVLAMASERLRHRRLDLQVLDQRVASFNDAWLAIGSGNSDRVPLPEPPRRRGGFLHMPLAFCALERGDLDATTRFVDAALSGYPDDDIPPGAYLGILLRGWVRYLAHEDGDARSSAFHLMRIAGEHGIALAGVDGLELLSAQLLRAGNPGPAAPLVGAAQHARDEMRYSHRWGFVSAALQPAPTAPGAGGTTLGSEAGAKTTTLNLQDAIDLAQRMRGERPRGALGWSSLSPTERRVVELASAGHSNAEIAARLMIGVATVKTHLAHAYAKVGVRNRTSLAAMATRRGLDGRSSPPKP